MSLQAGSRLGAYEIVAAIGAGVMAEVYRARDRKLDRDVDITADGRFIGVSEPGIARPGSAAAPQIQVVLNWFEELNQRVPVK